MMKIVSIIDAIAAPDLMGSTSSEEDDCEEAIRRDNEEKADADLEAMHSVGDFKKELTKNAIKKPSPTDYHNTEIDGIPSNGDQTRRGRKLSTEKLPKQSSASELPTTKKVNRGTNKSKPLHGSRLSTKALDEDHMKVTTRNSQMRPRTNESLAESPPRERIEKPSKAEKEASDRIRRSKSDVMPSTKAGVTDERFGSRTKHGSGPTPPPIDGKDLRSRHQARSRHGALSRSASEAKVYVNTEDDGYNRAKRSSNSRLKSLNSEEKADKHHSNTRSTRHSHGLEGVKDQQDDKQRKHKSFHSRSISMSGIESEGDSNLRNIKPQRHSKSIHTRSIDDAGIESAAARRTREGKGKSMHTRSTFLAGSRSYQPGFDAVDRKSERAEDSRQALHMQPSYDPKRSESSGSRNNLPGDENAHDAWDDDDHMFVRLGVTQEENECALRGEKEKGDEEKKGARVNAEGGDSDANNCVDDNEEKVAKLRGKPEEIPAGRQSKSHAGKCAKGCVDVAAKESDSAAGALSRASQRNPSRVEGASNDEEDQSTLVKTCKSTVSVRKHGASHVSNGDVEAQDEDGKSKSRKSTGSLRNHKPSHGTKFVDDLQKRGADFKGDNASAPRRTVRVSASTTHMRHKPLVDQNHDKEEISSKRSKKLPLRRTKSVASATDEVRSTTGVYQSDEVDVGEADVGSSDVDILKTANRTRRPTSSRRPIRRSKSTPDKTDNNPADPLQLGRSGRRKQPMANHRSRSSQDDSFMTDDSELAMGTGSTCKHPGERNRRNDERSLRHLDSGELDKSYQETDEYDNDKPKHSAAPKRAQGRRRTGMPSHMMGSIQLQQVLRNKGVEEEEEDSDNNVQKFKAFDDIGATDVFSKFQAAPTDESIVADDSTKPTSGTPTTSGADLSKPDRSMRLRRSLSAKKLEESSSALSSVTSSSQYRRRQPAMASEEPGDKGGSSKIVKGATYGLDGNPSDELTRSSWHGKFLSATKSAGVIKNAPSLVAAVGGTAHTMQGSSSTFVLPWVVGSVPPRRPKDDLKRSVSFKDALSDLDDFDDLL